MLLVFQTLATIRVFDSIVLSFTNKCKPFDFYNKVIFILMFCAAQDFESKILQIYSVMKMKTRELLKESCG